MSEPAPTPPRTMGRPVTYPGDPMHQITVWIPQSFYAKAVRVARERNVSVQRVLRMTLMRHLPTS
jgi:hypothetical protein